jgi:uncharacterized protein (UPF0276 family)
MSGGEPVSAEPWTEGGCAAIAGRARPRAVIPRLGVGAVFIPALEPLFLQPGLVDVLELEPQTLWHRARGRGPRYRLNRQAFETVAALPQEKIVHGVGFPIGGSIPADPAAVPPFVQSIGALHARWASEHLSFNEFGDPTCPTNAGFLLPPCQTEEGIAIAVRRIQALQARLPVPFAFETGVNYLRPQTWECSDGEFFARIAEEADCGILLDLHNLYANERNGRSRVRDVLARLPLDRVWEIHLAGGEELDGYWLDAHSGIIPEPVIETAADIVPKLSRLGAIVFEILPAYAVRLGRDRVAREIERARTLWALGERAGQADPRARRVRVHTRSGRRGVAPRPAEWENAIGTLLARHGPSTAFPAILERDPGLGVLRTLVGDARSGRIAAALRLTTTLLILVSGLPGLRALIDAHAARRAPSLFALNEADAFARYLKRREVPVPYLGDVLDFEHALIRAALYGTGTTVRFHRDPAAVLGALYDGQLPESPATGTYVVEVEPT